MTNDGARTGCRQLSLHSEYQRSQVSRLTNESHVAVHAIRMIDLPVGWKAVEDAVEITFSDPLEATACSDVDRYRIKAWDIKRTQRYGSDNYNERELGVAAAELLSDGRTVRLSIPDVPPTRGMEIVCRIQGDNGTEFRRVIHNTIHYLGTADTSPAESD